MDKSIGSQASGSRPFDNITIPAIDKADQFLEKASQCLKAILKVFPQPQDSQTNWTQRKCNKLRELRSRLKEFKQADATKANGSQVDELLEKVKNIIGRTEQVYKTQSSYVSATLNNFHFEKIDSIDPRKGDAFKISPETVIGVLSQFKADPARLMQMGFFVIDIFKKDIEKLELELVDTSGKGGREALQKKISECSGAIRKAENFLDATIPVNQRRQLLGALQSKKGETGSERKSTVASFTDDLIKHFASTGETEVVGYLEENADIGDQTIFLANVLETKVLLETDYQKPMDVLQHWPTHCTLTKNEKVAKMHELFEVFEACEKLKHEFSDLIYQYLFNFFDPTGEIRYEYICKKYSNPISWCAMIGELQCTMQKFGRETRGLVTQFQGHLAKLKGKAAKQRISSALFDSIRGLPSMPKGLSVSEKGELLKSVKDLVEVLRFKSAQFVLGLNFKEFTGSEEESRRSLKSFRLFFDQVLPDFIFSEIGKGKDEKEQKNVMYFFVLSALQLFNGGEESSGFSIFMALEKTEEKFEKAFEEIKSYPAYRDLATQVSTCRNYDTLKKAIDKIKKKTVPLTVPFLPISHQGFSITSDPLEGFALTMHSMLERGLTSNQLDALYKKIYAHGTSSTVKESEDAQTKWGKEHLFGSWRVFFRCLAELKVDDKLVEALKVLRRDWVRTNVSLMQWQDDFHTQCFALKTFYQDVTQESLPLDLLTPFSEREKNAHYKPDLKKVLIEERDSTEVLTGEGRLEREQYVKNKPLFKNLIVTLEESIKELMLNFDMPSKYVNMFLFGIEIHIKGNQLFLINSFAASVRKNIDTLLQLLKPDVEEKEKQWVDRFETICTLIFLTSELQQIGYLGSPLASAILENKDSLIEQKLKVELKKVLKTTDK